MRHSTWAVLAMALVLLIGATPVHTQDAAAVEAGAKVYAAQKCSICHSIAGVGNKKLPLDGVGAKLTVDQIREWIVAPVDAAKKGASTAKPPMRAYPNLPKADLDALVAYMKSLDKK